MFQSGETPIPYFDMEVFPIDTEKLLKTGDRCIYDEPAACSSHCPIHVDVRGLAAELEKGDFKKAYKLLEKRMPFARILGMICDHPCENVCVRASVGGAIRISELEKAAIKYGYTRPKKALPVPRNQYKVAVIGGGLSGMTAALELDKKGYKVTIYEKSDKLGGRLWDFAGISLEQNMLADELQQFTKLNIDVILNRQIHHKELQVMMNEYNAVFLSTGEWEEALEINPETFQVEGTPIFVEEKLLNKNDSIIFSVSSGRRAASSIERYCKGISMTAERGREGSFETPLQYEVNDVEPAAPVEKNLDVYSQEEAVAEAERCLKCRCTKCIDSCSHMKKFNIYPKNYTRQINNNENVIMGTRYANKMINSCTLCGLCNEQCHLDISMKDIIQETRESMVERGKMPPSAHDFALKDMEFSNSSHFFMVKSPPPIPKEKRSERERELFTYPRLSFSKYAQSLYKKVEPGTEEVDYLFYPGCQLSASSPEYVEKTYKYLLSKIKEGVGMMLGCCGAPADWAGRRDLMKENAERLRSVWLEKGKPIFILACSSCSSIFEKYLPDIQIVSLWEIFTRYGIPENARLKSGQVINVHDACTTRHNHKIHESVRKIATSLGCEIKELKYSKELTKCCGYGGLVYYANREQANEFVTDRMNESTEDMLVYCAMCKDLFVDGGKSTYHILDLIFGEDMDAISHKKMPTLSERHQNRAQLKSKLLKELWGEESDMDPIMTSDIQLIIPDDVKQKMEDRYILMEDIQKVIENAEQKKERFFDPEKSQYLANLRIANVTYWVRYEQKDNRILVNSVYSHRMEIVEE
jgi:Fe-S oxidoreductase